VEFALLGQDFAPAQRDDFVGVLGYMVWSLQLSWEFDPLYEDLVARVGPRRAAELFPFSTGPDPAVFTRPGGPAPRAALFDLGPRERALLDRLPRLAASNTWAIAPYRSATGHALLANDPHLDIGLPSTWYLAHLSTPRLDVAGATIPGLPLVVIGRNRDVAWGLTNLMLDSGDFFVEKTRPRSAAQALHKNAWVDLTTRVETIQVKGAPPVPLSVRSTPHGPLVSDLVPGRGPALSFCWSYALAEQTNDFDAVYDLDRARSWSDFRAAVRQMGGIAQNISYADRLGHIGLQATGAIPRRAGHADGTRFRAGWDGSEEWSGFVAFDENPWIFDPPEGVLAAANNPTYPSPAPYYVSSLWEPLDRIQRIREFLAARPKLGVDDLRALQADVVATSARSWVRLVREAFTTRPPSDGLARAALDLVTGWDGAMGVESPAAALFAVSHKHLFHEIFDDDLGETLATAYRARANVAATMLDLALGDSESPWLDRQDTPEREDRAAIVRRAFERAVQELRERLGGEPRAWTWGRIHTLTLGHPLGQAWFLAPYFNLGPHAMPGHALTVFKEESHDDFKVYMGPSLRQIVDLSDLAHSLIVIPGGQSGIPASRHYGDQFELWRIGEYHTLGLDRPQIDESAEGTLVLEPASSGTPHSRIQ
jgi:penicillin amidase